MLIDCNKSPQSLARHWPSMQLYSLLTSVITSITYPFLPYQYHRNLTIFLKTLPRDLGLTCKAVAAIFKALIHIKLLNENAVSQWNSVVKKYSNKPCFLFEDQVWTFKEVDTYTNKVAQIFLRAGLRKGDKVALLMTNRPEYPCIWLGLAKIGVVTALINYNLKNKPLTHCLSVTSSKVVIYSSDLIDSLVEVRASLAEGMRYFQLGKTDRPNSLGAVTLDELLDTVPPTAPPELAISNEEHLIYIFTSGTTGLPKAAIVPHCKYLLVSKLGWPLVDGRPDDVVYNPLPLYHVAGGMFGLGAALGSGATVVIKAKFSASSFIPDCIKYRCTVAQYIGEICRYLLALPEKPTDTLHNLRIMVGNGLRPAIWEAFVKRFKVPNIREIYSTTEGNLNFINLDNTVGAVGVLPRFSPLSRFLGVIIKVDLETMEPIRGPDGLCIECKIDEPGMFIGLLPSKKGPKAFYGYTDKAETKKKYIYDVFKKGDSAFVSGDLMVKDEMGYLFFKDRTGDTFRWKGENVSTSEVEAVISAIIGLRDCVVFGVQVGDLEGRAGMAAIVDPNGQIDLSSLPGQLDKALPRYAHPLFIRIVKEVELTGTFKLKKNNIVKEGCDPSVVKDPLYFRKGSSYIPLTKELYSQILAGEIKV